jgi:hypothetical protein
LVKIKVRADSVEKLYVIPRGLLIFHSAYFAAALDPVNPFVGSADGELVLEEHVKVFDAFYCWLYTGRLKDRALAPATTNPKELYLSSMSLCQIWVFADMRGVPAMKNAAIDLLHARTCALNSLSRTSLNFTYDKTVSGSALRQFFLDAAVKKQSYSHFLDVIHTTEAPADFWKESIPILMQQAEDYPGMAEDEWASMNRCQWHDHSGPGGKLRLESRT